MQYSKHNSKGLRNFNLFKRYIFPTCQQQKALFECWGRGEIKILPLGVQSSPGLPLGRYADASCLPGGRRESGQNGLWQRQTVATQIFVTCVKTDRLS